MLYPSEIRETISKEEALHIIENDLVRRGRSSEDPYDQDTFRSQMKALIESEASAVGAQYRFIQEKVPMLTVAVHYSRDKYLVEDLLKKNAHLGLTHEEIERCLITAANNAAPMPQKKAILELLIKHFYSSSSYFQGGPSNLDSLLFKCDPENLLVLIDALSEQGIDVYAVNQLGNTLLHRACGFRTEGTYNIDIRRLPDFLWQLLQSSELRRCIGVKNGIGMTPSELIKLRVACTRIEKPLYHDLQVKAGKSALTLIGLIETLEKHSAQNSLLEK